jgi:glycosyltransferase involved in cell wall biosynthesis
LVSAVVAAPDEGSEPGAGWRWTVAAAARHEVWLLVLDTSRARIDAVLAAQPDLRIRPVYLTQPRWLPGPSDDLRGLRLRYLVWQAQIARRAAALHAEIGFDVVHHLTLAADWLPAGVFAVGDVPVIWGPVGGHTRPAWRAARWFGPRWLAAEVGRRTVGCVGRAVWGRRQAARAALVVAQNPDAAALLRRYRGQRAPGEPDVALEPNVAVEAGLAEARSSPVPGAEAGGPVAVFAGRLVRWKGAHLALAALATPALPGWRLDVYGDGPQREALVALAARLRVTDRVRFLGARPRDEVLAALAQAGALVLPSLNDSAGWVAGEAVALGCPVVCLDRGGPPLVAAAGSGPPPVRVGPDLVEHLAAAIAGCAEVGHRPAERWSVTRLPDLLDGWYHAAAGAARAGTRGRS